MIEKFAF